MSRISHTVLSPKWPVEKQEHWWIYLTDSTQKWLFTPITSIYNLKNEKETTLQFQAPPYDDIFKYKVVLRSDSYLDCDRVQDVKLYISPQDHVEKIDAFKIWGDLETEEEKVASESGSDVMDKGSSSDDDSWEVDSE